jgi:hypothetical protein
MSKNLISLIGLLLAWTVVGKITDQKTMYKLLNLDLVRLWAKITETMRIKSGPRQQIWITRVA